MIPVVTLIGIDFGTVIGAAVLTETVFSWPGLGSEIADAVARPRPAVVLGLTLVVVLVYAIINLLVDLSYAWFDPRIRLGRGGSDDEPSLEPGTSPRAATAVGAAGGRGRHRRRRAPPGRCARTSGGASGATSWPSSGWCSSSSCCWSRSSPRSIAPYGITERDARSSGQGPSTRPLVRHRPIGRDVFSRVVYGARVSLRIGILATVISLDHRRVRSARSPASSAASADTLIMRITDIFLAIPYIILAVAIATVFGRSENSVILVLGLTGWLAIARIVRASFLSLKQLEYVEAAHARSGFAPARIMFRHILPNALQPIIVYGTIAVGSVILAEAALSFLRCRRRRTRRRRGA